MSSSNDQPPATTETKTVEEKPAAASEPSNPQTESTPDTDLGSKADEPAAEAVKESEKSTDECPAEPAAAEPEKNEVAAPAADESSAMDSSSDAKEKKPKRKASEIEEEPKENGSIEAVAEKTDADKSGEVATKKAKTVNGASTPTKVVPGDAEAAKAATEAMPKQAAPAA